MLERFRIVRISDGEFIIEAEEVKTITKGYLWWKETKTTKEFKRVDVMGCFRWSIGGIRTVIVTNDSLMETHKSDGDARKWIKDYYKYPIYGDVIIHKKSATK